MLASFMLSRVFNRCFCPPLCTSAVRQSWLICNPQTRICKCCHLLCDLQTYISALDEDLGRAQARMDIILGADNSSTAKQNEMLKAAAKQVTVLDLFTFTITNACSLE